MHRHATSQAGRYTINLHIIRYTLKGLVKFLARVGVGWGRLVNLDKSKAFDSVDYRYVAVVLRAVELDPTFHGWMNATYSDIESIVQVNGLFSRQL